MSRDDSAFFGWLKARREAKRAELEQQAGGPVDPRTSDLELLLDLVQEYRADSCNWRSRRLLVLARELSSGKRQVIDSKGTGQEQQVSA